MATNNIDNYLQWITPTPGDPTYSLLKAHLLIEELLRAHLARTLAHASALEGARLTFVQLLAVARAVTGGVPADHWMWDAMAQLNRLRNMLSHESQPKSLARRIAEYADFVRTHNGVPFPQSAQSTNQPPSSPPRTGPFFTLADMATLGLYIEAAARFGFDVEAFVRTEANRAAEVGTELKTAASNGDVNVSGEGAEK